MKIRGRELKYSKYDEKRYYRFIREQARQLREKGVDRETAESQAREIAAMYKHHFRVWK